MADDAIIFGDPARIDRITRQLDDFVELKYNREFRSVKGSYKRKTILILSTGVGAPSTAIAIEELHHIGVKRIIRVGSAGALQADIQLGAVRDDGLSKSYVPEQYPATPASDLLSKARRLAPDAVFGIIRSHDGFYMDGNEQTQAYWSKMGIIGEDMESGAMMTVGRLRGMATLSILNNVVLYEGDLQAGVNDLQAHAQVVEAGEKRTIRLALDLLSWEEK